MHVLKNFLQAYPKTKVLGEILSGILSQSLPDVRIAKLKRYNTAILPHERKQAAMPIHLFIDKIGIIFTLPRMREQD